MARYIKDFQFYGSLNDVYQSIYQQLLSSGYEYMVYNEEYVFKKGKGIFAAPIFFKISAGSQFVRLETWIKCALLPGVYVGEVGIDGMVGVFLKDGWREQLAKLENIIVSYSCVSAEERVATYTYTQSQNTVESYNSHISKKDFIDQYAQPSLRGDIRNVAITCYVCAGLTFILSFFVWGSFSFDALLLAGLALGMHLRKSKICAVLIAVLGGIEVLIGLVTEGRAAGLIWLLAGIVGVVTFNKLDKQYLNFLSSGRR